MTDVGVVAAAGRVTDVGPQQQDPVHVIDLSQERSDSSEDGAPLVRSRNRLFPLKSAAGPQTKPPQKRRRPFPLPRPALRSSGITKTSMRASSSSTNGTSTVTVLMCQCVCTTMGPSIGTICRKRRGESSRQRLLASSRCLPTGHCLRCRLPLTVSLRVPSPERLVSLRVNSMQATATAL